MQGAILAAIAVLVLALISAFVSASEAAFFSLGEDDLNTLRRSTKRNDKAVISVLENAHLLLLTCISVSLLSKVGIITIATVAIWESGMANFPVALSCFICTLGLLVFGDQLSRIYATKTNAQLASTVASLWNVLIMLCKPITKPVIKLRQLWEKRFEEKKSTRLELSQAFELASEAAETTESDKDILRGIVNFGTLNVRQVMRGRDEIAGISTESNFIELVQSVNKSGYSRIPVYHKTMDTIEGVLYTKDLLPFLGYPSNFVWQKLLRPPYFIQESKKIDLLLKDFQEKRVHIAIVVDDKGNTSGLITLEDLIEEIIGEINDEFDEIDVTTQKAQEKNYGFDLSSPRPDSLHSLDADPESVRQVSDRRAPVNRATENQTREG